MRHLSKRDRALRKFLENEKLGPAERKRGSLKPRIQTGEISNELERIFPRYDCVFVESDPDHPEVVLSEEERKRLMREAIDQLLRNVRAIVAEQPYRQLRRDEDV